MASSEIGKKLMREEMNHIDELFKQGLEGANVTPPPGVFEQCISQLNAHPLDVVEGLKASSKASKGWLGLSSKVAIGIGTGVLAVTAIVVAVVNSQEDSKNQVNRVELQSENGQTDVNAMGSEDNANGGGSRDQSVNGLIENVGVVGDATKGGGAIQESQEVPNGKGNLPINVEFREKVGSSMYGDLNGGLGMAAGALREDGLTTGMLVGRKNGLREVGPCGNHRVQWRPVISENVGGLVSLELEGDFGKIGIDWGDGLGGEVIENRGSMEKVSHAYWVERNRNFRIKLVHAMAVNKMDGGVIWCKDSQWLTLQVSPSNEASVVSVPDVFTPNGDGLNETFYVEMAKPLSYEITILDAKQRTVFRSNDYTEVWTGICGNRECDEANYRVILTYKYSGDKEWKYIRKSIKLLRKPINNIQN
jgi:gliding motility-associated-like protein